MLIEQRRLRVLERVESHELTVNYADAEESDSSKRVEYVGWEAAQAGVADGELNAKASKTLESGGFDLQVANPFSPTGILATLYNVHLAQTISVERLGRERATYLRERLPGNS